MTVPDIDHGIGIEVYSTPIRGILGSIKRAPDQFIVKELLDKSLGIISNADEEHEYPLYLLRKEGIDSNHAVREAETASGLKLKAIGLKDANAVTKQYVSSLQKHRNARASIVTKHCTLDLVGFTSKPITRGKLAGNSFTITITDFIRMNAEESVKELAETINKNCIANFYGYQRFGSARPVTHLVGREIVKRNFRNVVELFLCHPGVYDNREIMEIREACREGNYREALKRMPLQMDLERTLLQELVESDDPIRAFRKLPVNIRRLFVQAYQSYLFNRTLSLAVKDGHDITNAHGHDICFQMSEDTMNIKRFDPNTPITQLPAVPLIGYAFRNDNRFGSIAAKVMEDENVYGKDFYVKEMQEVSMEGGFRLASLLCKQFNYSLNESLRLTFDLNKGCYATVLLRELMKPADPTASGF